MAGADGKLRRAANVIWKPEDALRISKDIPCAFGLFYFPRDGELLTQARYALQQRRRVTAIQYF